MAATVSLAFGHCVCVSEGWPVVQFSQALRLKSVEIQLSPPGNAAYVACLLLLSGAN